MVNAVLRALDRERAHLAWPDAPPATALAIRHSHPEWLVERWIARYGVEQATAWLTFNNRAPRLCLAVNRLRGSREALARRLADEGVDVEPTIRSPYGLQVISGSALATRAFRDGWFVVQDEASQLVSDLGELRPGQRALDLCASPGGKSLALSGRMDGRGRLVACDVRPRRVRLLRQTLTRVSVEASIVQVGASGHLPFADAAFDYVLIDAPCSGLGTVRRDPDIRWSRSPGDLARLASTQLTLLRRAVRVVAPGGTLVYVTCSSEPDENEAVIAALLNDEPGVTLRHTHRTTPIDDGLEAFYGAVLARHV
jgi:16S rRNA (cytosine967-C5)-methyltransferase